MLVGTRASRYLYVPATSKMNEYVLPGRRTGDANVPVVETTWWLRVSSFRHRIVSPAVMLTVAGENDARLIETFFVVAAEAAGATASVAISDTSMRSDLRMPCSCPRPEAPKRCGMRFYLASYRALTPLFL